MSCVRWCPSLVTRVEILWIQTRIIYDFSVRTYTKKPKKPNMISVWIFYIWTSARDRRLQIISCAQNFILTTGWCLRKSAFYHSKEILFSRIASTKLMSQFSLATLVQFQTLTAPDQATKTKWRIIRPFQTGVTSDQTIVRSNISVRLKVHCPEFRALEIICDQIKTVVYQFNIDLIQKTNCSIISELSWP